MARLPTSPCNTIYGGQNFCATEEGPYCTLEIKIQTHHQISITPFNLIKNDNFDPEYYKSHSKQ